MTSSFVILTAEGSLQFAAEHGSTSRKGLAEAVREIFERALGSKGIVRRSGRVAMAARPLRFPPARPLMLCVASLVRCHVPRGTRAMPMRSRLADGPSPPSCTSALWEFETAQAAPGGHRCRQSDDKLGATPRSSGRPGGRMTRKSWHESMGRIFAMSISTRP